MSWGDRVLKKGKSRKIKEKLENCDSMFWKKEVKNSEIYSVKKKIIAIVWTAIEFEYLNIDINTFDHIKGL